MRSTLHCFGVAVVLFSLAPPVLSFSRGASRASCLEMVPGHIRAQPLDPRLSHVSLRTSASSYLPGQLVTVTVRSSRDFMGFLLQARSVDGAAVGAGVRSAGPVLVGGAWTLTPPGTHTLRCLSDGDTLSHSDKQLKRNLSFAWRAPDAPVGDIKFYITVVQSYFVYWAGIESTVVHDGSRRSWSNTTGANGGKSSFALQEDEVTDLPALRGQRPSSKRPNKTASPATALGRRSPTNTRPQSHKSQEEPPEAARPVLEMNNSTQKAADASDTDTFATPGSLSGVTDKGGPVVRTEEPKSSISSSSLPPITASVSSGEARGIEATTSALLSETTEQNPTSLLPLASVPPLNGEAAKMNFEDLKMPVEDTILDPETTTRVKSPTDHSFHNTSPSSGPIQDQTSSVRFETRSSSSQPSEPLIKDGMGSQSIPNHLKPQTTPFFQASSSKAFPKSQTSSPNLILSSKSPILPSFLQSQTTLSVKLPTDPPLHYQPTTPEPLPENSPKSGPKQTSSSYFQTSPSQDGVLLTDDSQSDTPLQASSVSPQPRSTNWYPRTEALQTRSISSFPTTSWFYPTFTLSESKGVKGLRSKANIRTVSPIFASTHRSALHPLTSSSFAQPTSSTSLYSSRRPALISKQISVTKASFSSPPSSSSMMNRPTTAPALSALPSPSPISIPPDFHPSLNSSYYPSPDPLFSSIPSSTGSTFPSSPPSSSSVSSPTSTSSPNLSATSSSSSSLVVSKSTAPHPEPSPVPRRAPHNPITPIPSSAPSQEPTQGPRLPVQNNVASSEPESNLHLPTPRTVVHLPNLDPNFKENLELKPNPPKVDAKPKRPPNPSGAPSEEGKYPDIIPRHRAWELGMLLGCSAGLGMVLVVAVRYMYRHTCGKRTEVTLNDREREYGRGERGLIHVQECGDLVRVRRIRENSFVLLAEYDILPSPVD